MKIVDTSTPVFVLNATHYGALGINRSLGRLGVKVYNQASSWSVPAFHSKYSHGNFLWDLHAAGTEPSVEYLVTAGRQLPRPALLIPTCDVTAMLVADHAEALRKWFIFPEQAAKLVHSLCSKKKLYELAKSCGVPTPETSFPESRTHLLSFLESARFPIVLKTIKNRIGQQSRAGLKMIVQSERELLSLYDEFEDRECPNLMLQEYVPGGDEANCMFNGYFDRDSNCLAAFTGNKVRQFPAYAGVTSLGVCRTNDVVANMTKAFMKTIGYRGIVDMGYRFDRRDGKYKIYDVNPRIGATFRLFVDDSGLDVARALYLDMTHQPVAAGQLREGRKWIVEDSDLLSSIRYYRDGRLTAREWIRSLRGINECALLAFDDLRPALARGIGDARKCIAQCKRHAWPRSRRFLPGDISPQKYNA